jgi:hypothetical protein
LPSHIELYQKTRRLCWNFQQWRGYCEQSEEKYRIPAQYQINLDLLPISAPFGGLRGIDFPQ